VDGQGAELARLERQAYQDDKARAVYEQREERQGPRRL
jgi:hypothetical protein